MQTNLLSIVKPYLPGLALTGFITAIAYMLSGLPYLNVLGALGIALILGLIWRALFGLPDAAKTGAVFSAKKLLRLGVILLGVRLNFALLVDAGFKVILLDLLIISIGLITMERIGKYLNMPRGLRLAVAIGSSICGASAIAAAAPIVKADDDEVTVAVGIVSVLGTIGVLGYTILAPILQLDIQQYGLMTGATLHEVAQVLAAGAAQGVEALDLATITKLTRVALLAPVLLIVGGILARRSSDEDLTGTKRPPLLPGFLVGFLIVGVLNSLHVFPAGLAKGMQTGSLILTAASMAGIGLGVDFGVLRRIGKPAAIVAVIGFTLLIALAGTYTTLIAA